MVSAPRASSSGATGARPSTTRGSTWPWSRRMKSVVSGRPATVIELVPAALKAATPSMPFSVFAPCAASSTVDIPPADASHVTP